MHIMLVMMMSDGVDDDDEGDDAGDGAGDDDGGDDDDVGGSNPLKKRSRHLFVDCLNSNTHMLNIVAAQKSRKLLCRLLFVRRNNDTTKT